MWDQFILSLDIASATICLFAAAFSLTQTQYRGTFRRLAYIFIAVFFAALPGLETQSGSGNMILLARGTGLVTVCAAFLIFPFLYGYILHITAEGPQKNRALNWLHYFPFYTAIFVSTPVFFLPTNLEAKLLSVQMGGQLLYLYGIIILLILLQLCAVVQWLIYTYLCHRVLSQFSQRAQDLFSNEEHRNLRWITWIVRALLSYALLAFIDQFTEQFLDFTVFHGDFEIVCHLCLVTALGLWGLRQTPRLRTPKLAASTPTKSKYAHSALATADQARIAKKLTTAMAKDRLYQDPDLSLGQLANHTGITAHYISQTLNEHIGVSFFDHVNHWRIEYAKKLLLQDEKTVLTIAYEAGFNTRSAFYRAFSKHTNQTPTAFRAALKK